MKHPFLRKTGWANAPACALIVMGLAGQAFSMGEPPTNTFKLREVSVFGGTKDKEPFLRGQFTSCEDKPSSTVTNYPKFVSKAPRFGEITFGSRETNSPNRYFFAVDESQGTGKGYDLLYLDVNQDLDLANDPVLEVQNPAPDKGYKPNFSQIKKQIAFDFVKVGLKSLNNTTNKVEVMPRMLVCGDEKNPWTVLLFVRTHIYEGEIQVGDKKVPVSLGNQYIITSLDSPTTSLVLKTDGETDWWGRDSLAAVHKFNEQFYTFSATPDGEVTVQPYTGELGLFEVGPGNRALTNFSFSGSLEGKEHSVAAESIKKGQTQSSTNRILLPVGDYRPNYLSVKYGNLGIDMSENYHSDGHRQNRQGRQPVYGFEIRKDRPYVLDFSNKPEVMFASPSADAKISPGDEVEVMAVLIDPKLDIMIRRLSYTSPKTEKDGGKHVSLDPKVVVTRANGEKVAEGVMPFG